MLLIIPSVTKGQPATIQLSKVDLFALSSVVADSYFSDQSNVKSCVIEYNSNPSDQKKVLRFDLSQQTPSSAVFMSETARDEFWLEHVILEDFDGGTLVLTRNELPSGLDISFAGGNVQLVSLSIDAGGPLVYVEQLDLNGSIIQGSTFESPGQVQVTKTPTNATATYSVTPGSVTYSVDENDPNLLLITKSSLSNGSLTVSSGEITSNSIPTFRSRLEELSAGAYTIGQMDGLVYYTNSSKLYRTDGTQAGTVEITLASGVSISGATNSFDVMLGGYLYFIAASSASPANLKLFRISTSSTTAEQVTNIRPGLSDGLVTAVKAIVFNSEIYFAAAGNKLYKTDGLVTTQLSNLRPTSTDGVNWIGASSDSVYFHSNLLSGLGGIYRTTGTLASTVKLSGTSSTTANALIGSFPFMKNICIVGADIFFTKNGAPPNPLKVYRYNPTMASPQVAFDLHPGDYDAVTRMIALGDKMAFIVANTVAAQEEAYEEGVFVFDGTTVSRLPQQLPPDFNGSFQTINGIDVIDGAEYGGMRKIGPSKFLYWVRDVYGGTGAFLVFQSDGVSTSFVGYDFGSRINGVDIVSNVENNYADYRKLVTAIILDNSLYKLNSNGDMALVATDTNSVLTNGVSVVVPTASSVYVPVFGSDSTSTDYASKLFRADGATGTLSKVSDINAGAADFGNVASVNAIQTTSTKVFLSPSSADALSTNLFVFSETV